MPVEPSQLRVAGARRRPATRSTAASTSAASSSAPSAEPSSGSTACSGWGIRPMTLPASLHDARDVADGAVAVLRVAKHDLVRRLEPRDSSSSAYQQPSPCLTGIISSWPGGAARA